MKAMPSSSTTLAYSLHVSLAIRRRLVHASKYSCCANSMRNSVYGMSLLILLVRYASAISYTSVKTMPW